VRSKDKFFSIVGNLWDLAASLLGDLLARVRRLLRPVVVERLNYNVSFSGDCRSYEHHLVTCGACGRRNRLRRRFEGAACGACKKPLAQPRTAN
jgi:hypothetical protein